MSPTKPKPDDLLRIAGERRARVRARKCFGCRPDVQATLDQIIGWAESDPGRFSGIYFADIAEYIRQNTSYEKSPEALRKCVLEHHPEKKARLDRALWAK